MRDKLALSRMFYVGITASATAQISSVRSWPLSHFSFSFCAAETERYDRREQTKDDYVFRGKGMELPMTPSTFTWRFKKILKANDLPTDLNVHSLRHTAASLFIASGTDVGTVAGLLGHSQPSTTLDIYTHAFDKNKKAASQIMQNALEI